MTKLGIGLCIGVLAGAALVLFGQSVVGLQKSSASTSVPSGPKRIMVPFMHMRNFGASAGHDSKTGEDRIGGGGEKEKWDIDEKRPLAKKEGYFTRPPRQNVFQRDKDRVAPPFEFKT